MQQVLLEGLPLWFRELPMLTLVAAGLAVAFWGVSVARHSRDYLVLSVCALGYGMVPLM